MTQCSAAPPTCTPAHVPLGSMSLIDSSMPLLPTKVSRAATRICLWATVPLAVIQLVTTTASLRMLLGSTTSTSSSSSYYGYGGSRSGNGWDYFFLSSSSDAPPYYHSRAAGGVLSPVSPIAATRRTIADALANNPSTGLDPIEPSIWTASDALEHLEFYYPGGNAVVGGRSEDLLLTKTTTSSTNTAAAADDDNGAVDSEQPQPPLLIYFITPTYYRPTQMADMTRLAQTLMHDKRIYWIVVEDHPHCTVRIRALLERTGLAYAHVNVFTDKNSTNARKFRGVGQRNRALDIVQDIGLPGVVYFGDDDNSYDVRLFEQIRHIKRVGVSGVMGTVGPYERCYVNATTGKVQGFVSGFPGKRPYPMDMAGFAFRSELLHEKKKLRFSADWPRGFLESHFVGLLVNSVDELEPLDNCTNLYAWHIKTRMYPEVTLIDRVAHDPDRPKLLPAV